MRIHSSTLLVATLLFVVCGCGQSSPAPVGPAQVTPPVPDPTQWAGKSLDSAVTDYLSAASTFTSTLKGIQNAAGVAPNQAAVLQTAQRLRLARFALADLSKGRSPDADTGKKLNEASAAVSQEVARLIVIPEAKQALHEAFILVRTAPAPQF